MVFSEVHSLYTVK